MGTKVVRNHKIFHKEFFLETEPQIQTLDVFAKVIIYIIK